VAWSPGVEMQIALDGLQPGDRVNLVTGNGSQSLLIAPSTGSFLTTAFMTTRDLRISKCSGSSCRVFHP